MRRNNMHKAFAGLLAMIVIMCAAVIGWTVAEPSTEQTTAPDPEPLVINTVEDGDDMLLTVIRDNGETVFQYEGKVKIWRGTDGKNYAILHLNEEVLQ